MKERHPSTIKNDSDSSIVRFFRNHWVGIYRALLFILLAINIILIVTGVGSFLAPLAYALANWIGFQATVTYLHLATSAMIVIPLSILVWPLRKLAIWVFGEKKEVPDDLEEGPKPRSASNSSPDSITPSPTSTSKGNTASSLESDSRSIPSFSDPEAHEEPVLDKKHVPATTVSTSAGQSQLSSSDPALQKPVPDKKHVSSDYPTDAELSDAKQYEKRNVSLRGEDGVMYISRKECAPDNPPHAWYKATPDATPVQYVVLDLTKKGGEGVMYLVAKPLQINGSSVLNKAWYKQTPDAKAEMYMVKSYSVPFFDKGSKKHREDGIRWQHSMYYPRPLEVIKRDRKEKEDGIKKSILIQQRMGKDPLPLWSETRNHSETDEPERMEYGFPKLEIYREFSKFIEGESLADFSLTPPPEKDEKKAPKSKILKKTLVERVKLANNLLRHFRDDVHSKGIVHGDVNPANFMLKADGNWQVIDYDQSFLIDKESKESKEDAHRLFRWPKPKDLAMKMAAPEREFNQAGKPTDIFSLSAIMIILLKGIGYPYFQRGELERALKYLEDQLGQMYATTANFSLQTSPGKLIYIPLVYKYLRKMTRSFEDVYQYSKDQFLRAPFDFAHPGVESGRLPSISDCDLEEISNAFLKRMMAHNPVDRPTIKEVVEFYETIEKCMDLPNDMTEDAIKTKFLSYKETLNRLSNQTVRERKGSALPSISLSKAEKDEVDRLRYTAKDNNPLGFLPAVVLPKIDTLLSVSQEEEGAFPEYLEALINDSAYMCMFILNPKNLPPMSLVSDLVSEKKGLEDEQNNSLKARWYQYIFEPHLRQPDEEKHHDKFLNRVLCNYLNGLSESTGEMPRVEREYTKEAQQEFIQFVGKLIELPDCKLSKPDKERVREILRVGPSAESKAERKRDVTPATPVVRHGPGSPRFPFTPPGSPAPRIDFGNGPAKTNPKPGESRSSEDQEEDDLDNYVV